MSELRIVRGRDLCLFIEQIPVFGVTELDVRSEYSHHPVREFLSSASVENVFQTVGYKLKLKIMSMFAMQIPTDREFTLSISEGGMEYIYEQCMVTDVYMNAQGNKNAAQTVVIKAERFRERVIEDE